MSQKIFDLAIVGMGPAGYTASIYASRYKLDNILIGELPGGLISESHKVCNYPSEDEITGLELAAKMQKHAQNLGGVEMYGRVTNIEKNVNNFVLNVGEKKVHARTVLLATGLKRRELNVTGEKEFNGKGVAYCATCDAPLFRNKTVAVVGGGDSATTASIYLSEVADKVYQIYRGSELKGEVAWIDIAKKNPKIDIIFNTNVEEIEGEITVKSLVLDKPYHKNQTLPIDGVFIEIGAIPDDTLFKGLGVKTEGGYIKVDETQATNIKGIYAAGDITTASNRFKQVVTACSEGAIAAQSIYEYIKCGLDKNKC